MKREKNIFDKLGSLIPGYRGYAERDSRRNCDKILRDKITDNIIICEKILNNRLKKLIKNKKLTALQNIEECRQKMNTLSDKIKYSPYGESAFFNDLQIREAELKKIYQLDYNMYLFSKNLKDDITNSDYFHILDLIESLNSLLKNRNDFIKGHI
tara:strand:- start:1334 stop:1798 length:465 start_codon:yes stop_codon:yes gene_type:complete